MHNTCVNKQFSIVFYIVLDSLMPGDPGYPALHKATPGNLNRLIANLNRAFKPICISFANCSTVHVPNFTYGKSWIKPITELDITPNYYTEKTINFYLVDTFFVGGLTPERGGYTYRPAATNPTPYKDIIVMEKEHLSNSDTTALHLMGHYFGLPDTGEEINPGSPASPPPPIGVASHEFSDGSNCYIHGDGFCDTGADPDNSSTFKSSTDGMGTFYLLPIQNYMSFYPNRSEYSQEQYNYMINQILTNRLYLH